LKALERPPTSLSPAAVGYRDDSERVPCPNNCGETFAQTQVASRHSRYSCPLIKAPRSFACPKCKAKLSRMDALRRHMQTHKKARAHVTVYKIVMDALAK
jgi:predicted RNA-binding Zn-ribbon protein involved in translation (DUF1610 family)